MFEKNEPALEKGSNDRRFYPNFNTIGYDSIANPVKLEFAVDNITNFGQSV